MKTKAVNKNDCSGVVNVSTNSVHNSYKDTSLIRNFNKGKSFTFTKWELFNTYTNDEFQQDFVTYKNALLACKKTHVANSEIDLVYDEAGNSIDVRSEDWIFVFSSGINYNEFYIDLSNGKLGPGLAVTSDNLIYANSNSLTTEDIKVSINLNDKYKKGSIIPSGTPVHELLNAIFSSERIGRGDGIQIYSSEMLSKMDPNFKPEQYISIPSEEELGESKEKDSYLDILFSSIRSLQAEVAKLRNSFKFGINSYVGSDTAVSGVVEDLNTVQDEEPLWSIEETDLSEIIPYTVDFEGTSLPFLPKENVIFTTPGKALIQGEAYWEDNLRFLRNNEDPKLFVYLTTSTPNIKFVLNTIGSVNNTVEVDLNNIFKTEKVDRYNIMLLNSRSMPKDGVFTGKDYIWISISNYETNKILAEGYYNPISKNLQQELYELDRRLCLYKIIFKNLTIYKCNFYSKYQDFSSEVHPSIPTDENYKYKVAHITIRSVKDYVELEKIESKLPNNELIWEENGSRLWIKSQNILYKIGGSEENPDKPDSGMVESEVIDLLKRMGIVYEDIDNELKLSNIGDVTFVNEDTGKKFKFEVSPKGELLGNELPQKTLAEEVKELQGSDFPIKTDMGIRGFIAKLHAGKDNIDASLKGYLSLNADRVKIGSIYCPLTTDVKHGCSHGFIELENTSDKDVPLEGCYLHFLHPNLEHISVVDSLPLSGILKAGSTYLIRCKQYADKKSNADVFINVEDYDKEWYKDGKLLDVSINVDEPYAFALTYGNKDAIGIDPTELANSPKGPISPETVFYEANTESDKKAKFVWKWFYIDSLVLNMSHKGENNPWGVHAYLVKSNSIIKNTFELDPAKQAFQALNTYDSSRLRGDKSGDIQYLNLDKEYISFYHSKDTFPVSNYTPRSSKMHKNVSTDKSKFDLEKPNLVSCAFGIDTYKTRCFNWVSSGAFDEYVFLKGPGEKTWKAFSSYKSGETIEESSTYPKRKEFQEPVKSSIYNRIHGNFPGSNIYYTSHKCIIDIVNAPVKGSPVEYTYIVGRKDEEGNPDINHCSKEYKFTLYPMDYIPRIYQITDQQGFDWIQYQVWAAAANKLNDKINADKEAEHIIPVLINTGDMTQNGTRINEWLDYYNAGEVLFNHLEQMNVVGNNDLCDNDPKILGTGDDVGKSNSFYFHVFYCYEVNTSEKMVPLVKNGSINMYIPSLYYFDFTSHRMMMVNSEITKTNCEKWYKKVDGGDIVNIYTGWTIPSSPEGTPRFFKEEGFTSIYTMIYNILSTTGSKKVIAVCHEMPFTVITNDSLLTNTGENYRSFGGSETSLIGCHMNQMDISDTIGIYWFSRLLEFFKVKLCLGGHKHTYAATLPVRENYYYMSNGVKKSSDVDGIMTMEETLEHDNLVTWFKDLEGGKKENLTKHPIVDKTTYNKLNNHTDASYIHPVLPSDNLGNNGVVYFMCQATGFKLTSNKELPSNFQEFAQLIPQTTKDGKKDAADNNQKYPMFTITYLEDSYKIKLIRIKNIFLDFKFTQSTFSKLPMEFEYATTIPGSRYCSWSTEDNSNFIITL